MKYELTLKLCFTNEIFLIWADDIHQMDLGMINDGIESCIDVLNGDSERLSWGLELSNVEIYKERSILTSFSHFVADFPTVEFCKMLEDYREALIYFKNRELRKYPL